MHVQDIWSLNQGFHILHSNNYEIFLSDQYPGDWLILMFTTTIFWPPRNQLNRIPTSMTWGKLHHFLESQRVISWGVATFWRIAFPTEFEEAVTTFKFIILYYSIKLLFYLTFKYLMIQYFYSIDLIIFKK